MVEEGNEELQLDESLFAAEQPEATEVTQEADPQLADSAGDTQPEDELPEKYRGKTPMEIVRMHQDAERLIGKQGNEVGELRKIVDDIVQKAQPSEQAPTEPEVDFFEDPKGATAKTAKEVLASDPEYQKMRETVQHISNQNAAEWLIQRHPDAVKVANDPQFTAWVQSDPIRKELHDRAHSKFDYQCADSLFNMYKETKAYNSDVAEAAKATRKQDVSKASTGSGKASSETRGEPILSREAIVDLMIKDPERYRTLLPTLKKAYGEGRAR